MLQNKIFFAILIVSLFRPFARSEDSSNASSNSSQTLSAESYQQKNQRKRSEYLSIKKDLEEDAGEIFQQCALKQSVSKTAKVVEVDQTLNKSNGNITHNIKNIIRDCMEAADSADKFCMEDMNPQLRSGVDALSGLISGTAILSRQAACGKYKNGIKILTAAIAGFQGTCAVMKARCQSKCEEALSYVSANAESEEKAVCAKVESRKNEILNVDLESNIQQISITMNPIKECIEALKPQYEHLADDVNGVNMDWSKMDPAAHPLLIKVDQLNQKLASCNHEVNVVQLNSLTEKLRQNFVDGLALKKSKNQCGSCLAALRKLKNPIAVREKACSEYGTQIMLAGAGIAGLLQQVKSKKLCGQEIQENTCNLSNSETWTAVNCATFCSESANKNAPACRCILNPLASGCRQPEQKNLSVQEREKQTMTITEKSNLQYGIDKKIKPNTAKVLTTSSRTELIKKLDADIQRKQEQQKLRGLASEDDPRLQITGAGGKTNWDKASDRYMDMSGQMLKEDD